MQHFSKPFNWNTAAALNLFGFWFVSVEFSTMIFQNIVM